jgi:glycine cleavage system pyridoxal-binding protein P
MSNRNKVIVKARIHGEDYEVLKTYAEEIGLSIAALVRLDLHRLAESIQQKQ